MCINFDPMKKISYVLLLMNLVFLGACATEEEKTVYSFVEELEHVANKAIWKTMINTNPNVKMNDADVAIEVSYLRMKEIRSISQGKNFSITPFEEGKNCGFYLPEGESTSQIYCLKSNHGCAIIQLSNNQVTSITPLVSENTVMRWY